MEIDPIKCPTEWDELQAKYGNLPDPWETYNLAKELTKQYRAPSQEELAEDKAAQFENATLSDLSDLEDSEDEEFLALYRNKRLEELKNLQLRAKFGSLTEIRANEFVDQVTNVRDHFVVCLLYQEYVPVCKRIIVYLSQLAQKFPDVKFVKIVGSECIPNYPDSNIPTILIYDNGEKKHFIVGSAVYGGNQCSQADIEFWLGQLGIVDTDIVEDPRLQKRNEASESRFRMYTRRSIRGGQEGSDSDY
ncbi:hypothetical protein P9112_004332 [Eukaryota sp. TZLM1-RC]